MSKKEKFFDVTMIKFLIVGAINTLVGSRAMFLLYNPAHPDKWVCIAANYLIGGIVSFFLNKYFTFRNRERSWAQVGRFARPSRGWFWPLRHKGFSGGKAACRSCLAGFAETSPRGYRIRPEWQRLGRRTYAFRRSKGRQPRWLGA